ncbi:recombination protein O N-terminal domain-containing protein [Mycoplasmopsis lipofaciens]|uniref:recombination protein O N-terminal domain-containing protein n=1 Tax=Mycoplasmopsis lipofaciens TaxID=114884 RepID=UPI000485786B|nr:recombination protein O N-terminal domain-containing protein [Mycoplasmopsis lipofaciens]
MAEKIEKVILLDINDYSNDENAGIITVLGKNGVFSLLAMGINKGNSKNKSNLQVGSLIEIEYFKARLNNKLNKLKKAKLLYEIDYSNKFNLVYVAKATKFLKNFTSNAVNIINTYIETFEFLGKGYNDFLLTYLIANSLYYFGLKPNIESCVECNSPGNLCDFEFYIGGYLCALHAKKQRWTKELKSVYYLFQNLKTYMQICIPQVNNKIYLELLHYLKDNGIYINWEQEY